MSVALTLAQAKVQGPAIDWAGLSPLLALLGGATIVLLLGLVRARAAREVLVPFLALVVIWAAGAVARVGVSDRGARAPTATLCERAVTSSAPSACSFAPSGCATSQ